MRQSLGGTSGSTGERSDRRGDRATAFRAVCRLGALAGAPWSDLNRRSRSELVTTKTLDPAIAAPAISGLSRPGAASGSAATL